MCPARGSPTPDQRHERTLCGRCAAYAEAMPDSTRAGPPPVEDVHELALTMPHVTVYPGTGDNPIYQVGGKSFIFFRNPRPDAVIPRPGSAIRM